MQNIDDLLQSTLASLTTLKQEVLRSGTVQDRQQLASINVALSVFDKMLRQRDRSQRLSRVEQIRLQQTERKQQQQLRYQDWGVAIEAMQSIS